MKTNLPQEYKGNFFSKLILKIKNLFFKDKNIDNSDEIQLEKTKENNVINYNDIDVLKNENKINFDEQSNYNIRNERKKFLKSLINSPELLEHFSNDKLEVILAEYQKENEIKKAKLKKYGENI